MRINARSRGKGRRTPLFNERCSHGPARPVPDVRYCQTGIRAAADRPLSMLSRVNPHGPPAFARLRHGRQGRGYIGTFGGVNGANADGGSLRLDRVSPYQRASLMNQR